MLTGTIKFFHPVKNYGFIRPNEGGKNAPEIFFYATEFDGEVGSLKPMQWVEYGDVIETPRGPRALRVALCKKRGQHERANERDKVIAFGTD
jgi:cold shock CspA family protein